MIGKLWILRFLTISCLLKKNCKDFLMKEKRDFKSKVGKGARANLTLYCPLKDVFLIKSDHNTCPGAYKAVLPFKRLVLSFKILVLAFKILVLTFKRLVLAFKKLVFTLKRLVLIGLEKT